MPLKIAVPNKGRLFEEALDLLRNSGIRVVRPDSRLVETVNNGRYQVLFVRADDIPSFVESGSVDVGVTGLDLVEEYGAKVEKLLDLNFGYCKLVVACPNSAKISSASDIPANAKISTPFPNLTRKFFNGRKNDVQIISVSGATEITPMIGVSDYIVDLVQTGSTLRQHNLTQLDVIMDTWAVIIANKASARLKEVRDLVDAVKSVIDASKKRYLMANVHSKDLKRVCSIMPGLSAPTIMKLSRQGMYAIHAVIEEETINDLLAKLKKAGASGILIMPIERMVV
jgi:ATP phosphoribosyltransferase